MTNELQFLAKGRQPVHSRITWKACETGKGEGHCIGPPMSRAPGESASSAASNKLQTPKPKKGRKPRMKDYGAPSRKHFDHQAAEYDARDTVYYSREGKISCRDIASQLKAVPYEALLDVGCGTGFLIDLLARQRPARYAGLDLSPGMIRMAEGKQIEGAEFVVGSADRLPFPDHTFEIVTCSQSFHHYPYPDKAMAEAFRVLKPGGLYILSDTGIGGVGGWIDNHILFRLARSGDCHTTNRRGIARMMEKAGFTVTESRQIQGMIYTVTGRKGAK